MAKRFGRGANALHVARWVAAIPLVALLGYGRPGLTCSLTFTSPARGSTVTSATVGVSGTGTGTANAGDPGTVTATINGQVFFSQSGTFTTLINFLGSGAASVSLRAGANVLNVSGSAGACSASDSMVVYYTPPPPPEQKAAGAPQICNGTNPIDGGNGNKFQTERDYVGAGPFPLLFERYYNSRFDVHRSLGQRWQHSYDRRITATNTVAYVIRSDGRALRFAASGATWRADADVSERLTRLTDGTGKLSGWEFVDVDDTVESYDGSGRLMSIRPRGGQVQNLTYDGAGRLANVAEAPFGRRLAFGYDASNRLISVTDPGDTVTRFAYDPTGRLVSVTYPDLTVSDHSDNPKRQYLYEDARFPHALTGLIDENGIRYATWTYDADGRAISSEHAGGVDRFRLAYNADGSSTVTDPLGAARSFSYQSLLGVPRATGLSEPCATGCGAQTASTTYDANANVVSRTDFNGARTDYVYDLTRNLELSRTEAVATPAERSVTTQWHPSFRVPTRVVDAKQVMSFAYDPSGRLVTRKVTVGKSSRFWRFSYDPDGQISRVNGPRTDVPDLATFTYYAGDAICPTGHPTGCRGQVQSSRNAKGHLTTFSDYDAHGRVGRVVDANESVTTFAYDARGRVTRTSTDGSVTAYVYDKAGNLLRVTAPNGAYLASTYDGAHRLTGIADRAGNRIQYTLDAAGHRVQEDVYDAADVRVRTRQWAYDTLSRLSTGVDGSGHATSYSYDAGGNLMGVLDPANRSWSQVYDALNRMTAATDAAGGVTRYQYDTLDRLLKVTDAEGLNTTYTYSGFGDLTQQVSPDTGKTRYTYDSAGNRSSRTNADGVIAHYAYDALNRLVSIDYPGTQSDVAYVWDSGVRQKGFLKQARRGDYTANLTWTRRGKLASVQRSKNGVPIADGLVRYAYDKADQLVSIRFGDSRDVQYTYNANGLVSRVQVVEHTTPGDPAGDRVSTLASAIEYLPFGPVKSLTYGNRVMLWRAFDLDYRLKQQTIGTVQKLAYAYDAAGNLSKLTNKLVPGASQSFVYDPLDRLIQASGPLGVVSYTYDAIGNRVGEMFGAKSTAYVYPPASHQLHSANGDAIRAFSYSAAGSVLTDGNLSFSYDPDGRLGETRHAAQVLAGYAYDAFGQRVEKTSGGTSRFFEYDQSGRLLRETGRDYVYLNGELLALLDGENPHFVHGNHLGAPAAVTNGAKQTVWRAEYEPFGKADLTNPGLTLNVRLPGQYFDAETGLHYNYFRDYDPTLGRYIQSDPIGLAGGMSTYAYAANNPINAIDPDGRIPFALIPAGNYMLGLFLGGGSSAALQYAILGSVDINQTIDDALFGGILGIINPALGLSSGLRAARCTVPSVPPVARSLTNYYPQNNGFIDHGRAFTLLPGTRVDRFGFSGGRFLSPEGTPATMRSLPPLSFQRPYRKFEVVKPLEVQAGEVAPAFGELGLGTQFVTQESIRKLIASGHLMEVSR